MCRRNLVSLVYRQRTAAAAPAAWRRWRRRAGNRSPGAAQAIGVRGKCQRPRLIEKLGVPTRIGYQAIHCLDAQRTTGFPQKQKLWGDRRYWPAVLAYFDFVYGFKLNGDRWPALAA